MRGFWALPAVLRVALASQHAFSVQDDVLAYPQFEVTYTDDALSPDQAKARLSASKDSPIDLDIAATELALNDIQAQAFLSQHKADPEYQYEELVLNHQRYSCQIPIVSLPSPSSPDINITVSKAEEEKELQRANERGWELLQGMQGNCIFYWSGWWSYRYCHGQGVKQFHSLPPSQGIPNYPPVEDPGVTGFMLGAVEEEVVGKEVVERGEGKEGGKALGHLETRGDSRYLVQRLEGGTVCDLTGKQRRIEVQFYCDPVSSDRISSIQEVATCAYLMVIKTSRLCNDVAFLPPQEDKPNTITCSPIISDDEISDEHRNEPAPAHHVLAPVAQDNAPNPFQDSQQHSKPAPVIGGIHVGAHKWVPLDQTILKSSVVKPHLPGKIVDSKGNTLTAAELEKLGLGGKMNQNELKRRVNEVADGRRYMFMTYETLDHHSYKLQLLDEDGEWVTGRQSEKEAAGSREEERKDAKKDGGEERSEEQYMDEV